jgi:hypothetical protein
VHHDGSRASGQRDHVRLSLKPLIPASNPAGHASVIMIFNVNNRFRR